MQQQANNSLEEAITKSPVGMALTCTPAGHFILVHMHDISPEDAGTPEGAFDGTIWTRAFSMEYGLVAIPGWPEIAFYGDKKQLHQALEEREVHLHTGWQSVANALL